MASLLVTNEDGPSNQKSEKSVKPSNGHGHAGANGLGEEKDDEETPDEESDSNDEDEEDSAGALEKDIRAIVAGLETGEWNADQDSFWKKYEKQLDPSRKPEIHGGPLDAMATNKSFFTEKDHQWFLDRLLVTYPGILEKEDRDNFSPLNKAIWNKSEKFIKGILNTGYAKKDESWDFLAKSCGRPRGGNYIHLAIEKGLRSDVTVPLIKKAPKIALTAITDDELTPLHLAVGREGNGRLRGGTIKALLELGDEALDRYAKSRSVYLHHMDSLSPQKGDSGLNYTKKTRGDLKTGRKRLGREHEGNVTVATDAPKIKPSKNGLEERGEEKNSIQDDDHRTQHNIIARPGAAGESQKPNEEEQADRAQRSSKDKDKTGKESKPQPKRTTPEEVANLLKLHYLRSIFRDEQPRNYHSAIRFLFGNNPRHNEIYLDLLRSGPEIRATDFERAYNGFAYDEVMLSVAAGKIDLIDDRKLADANGGKAIQVDEAAKPLGRADMVFFFQYLRKTKKVKHIIKVLIEDDVQRPHSDEAIEEALKDIAVEILDWRKLDMCPQLIQKIGTSRHLREVHLQWSGNNALLRAWSEPDGLASIKSLRKVYVHLDKYVDSKNRTTENFKAFQERLSKESKNRITVAAFTENEHTPRRAPGGASTQNKAKVGLEAHRWFEVMDPFIEGLCKVDEKILTYNTPFGILREDVRVALIDDGVNTLHPQLVGRIEGGQSFDQDPSDHDLTGAGKPFQFSETGHGTVMAKMITRICPRVKILVCKLQVSEVDPAGIAHFTVKSATEAINYAVLQGVDAICMSWTIMAGTNANEMKELDDAVGNACRLKKLLFCAMPDIGTVTADQIRQYYPVGCSNDHKFRVGAATASGSRYCWTPDNTEYPADFNLPGHNVVYKPGDVVPGESNTPMTGSSIATALATGFAALIIHIVRLGAILSYHDHSATQPQEQQEAGAPAPAISRPKATPLSIESDDVKKIRQYEHMKTAIRRAMKDGNAFEEPGKIINEFGIATDKKMNKIARLAYILANAS